MLPVPRDRARERARAHPRTSTAWLAFLGAPVAWVVHIGVRYPLVAVSCAAGTAWPLHAVSIVCMISASLSIAAAVVVTRRTRAALEDRELERDPDDELAVRPPEERRVARNELLGRAGLVLGIVFLLAILAEAVTALVIDPCAPGLTP
ncbi:MAG: hypothetical protein M3Y87_06465 [Myxococcota bacterium]|nr:hypothetical protein [Myxococcota bacterium]